MTNDQFLLFLFPDRPASEHVFTASFPGDPSSGNFRLNPFLLPGNNNYFCVSTLSSPERRTPENCAALAVLVVDDVGEKIPPEKVRGILGDPTYVLETSLGSYQWGYRLNPPARDPSTAEGLVRGLARVFTADMAGRNRLARLPVGVNGKRGKGSFSTHLAHLDQNVSLTPEQAMERLEATPVAPEELVPPPALPPDRDPVLIALEVRQHPYTPTLTPGTYRLTCPWVEEHTGGRDDGTVYLAPAGFKCHHGHCAYRTFADFRKWLELDAGTIDAAIVEAELLADRESPKMFVSGFSDFATGEGVSDKKVWKFYGDPPTHSQPDHPWANATLRDLFHDDWTPLSRAEVAAKYPRQWLFDNTIPMGVPWGIAGEGGLGKSRLCLALCMSVATGIPFGDFVPTEKNGAKAVFLTQEDTQPDRAHRAQSQLEYMAEHDPRWHSKEVCERIGRNLVVPTLPYGQTLTRAFQELAQGYWAGFGGARLVMFDPLILFWDHGDEENSINSAKGTVHTIRRMIEVARAKNDPDNWSIGMAHHLSRQGNVYGSVMIEAHLRTVFGMRPVEGEPGVLELEVLKVNASNIKGRIWRYGMEPVTGALYPIELFPQLSNAQKLAQALHSGLLTWDQPPSALVRQACTTDLFGADPATAVKAVLDNWRSSLPDDLGLTREPYNRYKPIIGFELEA